MRPPEEAVEAAERLEATMTEAKAATPTMAATAAAQAGAAAVTQDVESLRARPSF